MLNNPANGMVNCTLEDDGMPTVGDVCDYMCDNGFVQIGGDTRRSCGNDGMWTGSAAVCGTGNVVNMTLSWPPQAGFKD